MILALGAGLVGALFLFIGLSCAFASLNPGSNGVIFLLGPLGLMGGILGLSYCVKILLG